MRVRKDTHLIVLLKKGIDMKKKKRITRNDLDKMPFEKREKIRKQLREEAVYTRSFRTKQSFGAASPVRQISVIQYLSEKQSV